MSYMSNISVVVPIVIVHGYSTVSRNACSDDDNICDSAVLRLVVQPTINTEVFVVRSTRT